MLVRCLGFSCCSCTKIPDQIFQVEEDLTRMFRSICKASSYEQVGSSWSQTEMFLFWATSWTIMMTGIFHDIPTGCMILGFLQVTQMNSISGLRWLPFPGLVRHPADHSQNWWGEWRCNTIRCSIGGSEHSSLCGSMRFLSAFSIITAHFLVQPFMNLDVFSWMTSSPDPMEIQKSKRTLAACLENRSCSNM